MSISELLAVLGLAVGVAGGALAVVAIILSLLMYRATSAINTQMVQTEARIAETTAVLRTLLDGLLSSMAGHLTRQNEQMLAALTAASRSADRAVEEVVRSAGSEPTVLEEIGKVKEQIDEVMNVLVGPRPSPPTEARPPEPLLSQRRELASALHAGDRVVHGALILRLPCAHDCITVLSARRPRLGGDHWRST